MALARFAFSANISMLFAEARFLDRFGLARSQGFDTVEFLFPYDYDLKEIKVRLQRHGLSLALFDAPPGNRAGGEFGLLGAPGSENRFEESFVQALDAASYLGCRRINVLFGNIDQRTEPARQLDCALRNLQRVLPRAADHGICLLIEALNPLDFPHYFLHDTTAALELVDSVDHSALRLQYDVYHAAMGNEDILGTLEKHLPRMAHIQIADAPGRHEPGSGLVDYAAVFDRLRRLGYDGCLGLEYVPSDDTVSSLHRLARVLDGQAGESAPAGKVSYGEGR